METIKIKVSRKYWLNIVCLLFLTFVFGCNVFFLYPSKNIDPFLSSFVWIMMGLPFLFCADRLFFNIFKVFDTVTLDEKGIDIRIFNRKFHAIPYRRTKDYFRWDEIQSVYVNQVNAIETPNYEPGARYKWHSTRDVYSPKKKWRISRHYLEVYLKDGRIKTYNVSYFEEEFINNRYGIITPYILKYDLCYVSRPNPRKNRKTDKLKRWHIK